MNIFHYDQTFDGLLTTIFEAYRTKHFPHQLLGLDAIAPLFTSYATTIMTDPAKAQRVWNTVNKKTTTEFRHQLLYAWLSEEEGSDLLILNTIRKLTDSPRNIETAYADPEILSLRQLSKKVGKECCFTIQFVRFQKTQDNIYFAPVEPACNVLPIAIPHFKDRFADQKWIIYDTLRNYGFFYNLQTTQQISLDQNAHFTKQNELKPEALTPDEILIQKMWKNYFKAVNITERRNLKQQRQHMPQRFWHLLPEMRK